MSFTSLAKQPQKPRGVPFVPHGYQLDCIKWLIAHPAAGQFLPPGLGKTSTVLKAFKMMKDAGIVDTLFVLAPIRVMQIVWPAELKKWADFHGLTIAVLHGDKDNAIKKTADVYVINPDGLKWFSKHAKAFFARTGKTMLVVDESSQFRNSRSIRFKLLKALLPNFTRRVVMTGTPVPNGIGGIWAQINILDNGQRLGRFVTHFHNTYFYPAGYKGYEWRLREGANEEIYEKIADIVIHKSRDELDMPELINAEIEVAMPPSAKRIYDDMKDTLIAELDGDKTLVATIAATMIGKLKQISGGAAYTGNDGSWVHIHDAKLEAVEELHDELNGRPLLVFYEYRHDLERLMKRFPFARRLGGGMSSAEANATVLDWNAGNVSMLLLHPMSAGHGLNLQAGGCEDLVWFTITYDAELWEQAIARVWRQGVDKPVTNHCIVAAPIDRHILNVLSGKLSVQDALLEALRQ